MRSCSKKNSISLLALGVLFIFPTLINATNQETYIQHLELNFPPLPPKPVSPLSRPHGLIQLRDGTGGNFFYSYFGSLSEVHYLTLSPTFELSIESFRTINEKTISLARRTSLGAVWKTISVRGINVSPEYLITHNQRIALRISILWAGLTLNQNDYNSELLGEQKIYAAALGYRWKVNPHFYLFVSYSHFLPNLTKISHIVRSFGNQREDLIALGLNFKLE